MNDPVRQQYERFPYPPIPWPALPRRGQGAALRFETAAGRPHDGIRILVAGAGTLEALVVAQAHPRAAEVVAVDVSGAALLMLRRRTALGRLSGWLRLRRLPPIRCVQADLNEWEGGEFDYIVASNLLHHLPDPAATLERLAGRLPEGGVLRLRSYPRHSRFWVRETGRWLRASGITPRTPRLVKAAHAAIDRLPDDHPLRAAFRAHGERHTATGLVDAFLHARENPLAPLQWRAAAARAGLTLVAEGQSPGARSDALLERLPATSALDRWERLQVMDDLLELTASPILWLRKVGGGAATSPPPWEAAAEEESVTPLEAIQPGANLTLPSRPHWELAQGLRRAERVLAKAGVALEEALDALRREVEPRSGVSIVEQDIDRLLALPRPWDEEQWRQLERRLGPGHRLHYRDRPIPGAELAAQAAWLQSRYGTVESRLGPVKLTYDPTASERRSSR